MLIARAQRIKTPVSNLDLRKLCKPSVPKQALSEESWIQGRDIRTRRDSLQFRLVQGRWCTGPRRIVPFIRIKPPIDRLVIRFAFMLGYVILIADVKTQLPLRSDNPALVAHIFRHGLQKVPSVMLPIAAPPKHAQIGCNSTRNQVCDDCSQSEVQFNVSTRRSELQLSLNAYSACVNHACRAMWQLDAWAALFNSGL